MHRSLLTILCALVCNCGSGCVIVDVKVTNPIPGMAKVAIAPFFNLSDKPNLVVDSRRFALAYFTELQKVPGFQVVPVGVTEIAIREAQLQMDDPRDVARLAQLLNVDVVVVGAITDYDPYYPPRIGLDVEWISPIPWSLEPGIPIDPHARRSLIKQWKAERERRKELEKDSEKCKPYSPNVLIRGQSPNGSAWPSDSGLTDGSVARELSPPAGAPTKLPGLTEQRHELRKLLANAQKAPIHAAQSLPNQETIAAGAVFEPQTVMSYTRIFDGKDADLAAALRDYIELSGDTRSGGWEGYLHRSDDFIRFASHRMIEEMLVLHGGEAGRRIVVKLRKER